MCSIFEHIPDQKETEQIFQWIEQLDNDRVLEVLRLQPDMINHRSRESGCPVSHYIARHGNMRQGAFQQEVACCASA